MMLRTRGLRVMRRTSHQTLQPPPISSPEANALTHAPAPENALDLSCRGGRLSRGRIALGSRAERI